MPGKRKRPTKRRTRRHVIPGRVRKVIVSSGRKHQIKIRQAWKIFEVDAVGLGEGGGQPRKGEWRVAETAATPLSEGGGAPPGAEWDVTAIDARPLDEDAPAEPLADSGPWRIAGVDAHPLDEESGGGRPGEAPQGWQIAGTDATPMPGEAEGGGPPPKPVPGEWRIHEVDAVPAAE